MSNWDSNWLDLYDVLSTNIAQEVEEDLRAQLHCFDEPMFEKDVDELVWSAAMEVCEGDIDHYDVIDMAKAKIESSLYQGNRV